MLGVAVNGFNVEVDRRQAARWPDRERRSFDFGHGGVTLDRGRSDDVELHRAAREVLTEADRREFSAIGHPELRQRAAACRTLLRRTLSRVHGGQIRPQTWEFERTSDGRSVLASGLPATSFSVSYSGRNFVIAASRTRAVGIDIEGEAASIDLACFDPYLTRTERAALNYLPPDRQKTAFLRLWTLKEAYIKLIGTGLAADLSKIEFSLDPVRLSVGWAPIEPVAEVQFAVWSRPADNGPLHISLAMSPL